MPPTMEVALHQGFIVRIPFLVMTVALCAGCNLFGTTPGTTIDMGEQGPADAAADARMTGLDAGANNIIDAGRGDAGGAGNDGGATDLGTGDDGGVTDMAASDGGAGDTGAPDITWVSIEAAEKNTCALDSAGRVFCWGGNDNAQLGNGGTATSLVPVQVTSSLVFTSIAVGDDHACAIDDADDLWCWGFSFYIGSDNGGVQALPFQPNALKYASIRAGHDSVCGVDDQGALWCWGDNDVLQLGVDAIGSSLDPVQPQGGYQPLDYDLGNEITCALTLAGAPECWGRDLGARVNEGSASAAALPITTAFAYEEIALGEEMACARRGGAVDCWGNGSLVSNETVGGTSTSAGEVPANVDFVQIDVGDGAACGLTADGTLHCWGSNYRARQGLGRDNPSPGSTNGVTPVDTTSEFIDFSLGISHGCGITTDNDILCWGQAINGRLGNGELGWSTEPVEVVSAETFTMVDASEYSSCGVTVNDEVYCWGRGRYRALGNGSLDHVSVPTLAPGASATFLEGAGSAVLVMDAAGNLSSWGQETYGELGNGSGGDQLLVGPLDTTATFSVATLGWDHGCAIASQGNSTYCWGKAEQNGALVDLASPTALPNGFPNFIDISAGVDHVCGLTMGGGARCFGRNDDGQLGDDSLANSPTAAVTVQTASSFVEIVAGYDATCARTATGDVECWGDGSRTGDGGFGDDLVPVGVDGNHVFDTLSTTAYEHFCGIEAGTVWCWGLGGLGRLGDGSTGNNSSPNDVTLPEDAVQVSAGADHTCAVGVSGKAYCWGYREFGRLGDGKDSLVVSPTPVDLSGIPAP